MIVRVKKLGANEERLDAADRHEKQRCDCVQHRDFFMIDGVEPTDEAAFEVARLFDRQYFRLRCHAERLYFRLSRYATRSLSSAPRSPKSGIRAPGLSSPGCSIHAARCCGSFANTPDAIVVRLARCVRSGPT